MKTYGYCRTCQGEKPLDTKRICEPCRAKSRMGRTYAQCRRCGKDKAATMRRLCDACRPVTETRKRTYVKCWHCKGRKRRDSQRVCRRCSSLPEIRKRQAKWQAAYKSRWPDKIKARLEAAKKVRETIIAHYGGKCVCCGETEYAFLQIDHIEGGGHKHRTEGGGANIARWLTRQGLPEGYRVLCGSCHNAVSYHGCCPHNPAIRTERKVIPISSTLREP